MATSIRHTCLNRFLGLCPDCKEDYNPDHRPNNMDCPRYERLDLMEFNVQDLESHNIIAVEVN